MHVAMIYKAKRLISEIKVSNPVPRLPHRLQERFDFVPTKHHWLFVIIGRREVYRRTFLLGRAAYIVGSI